MSKLSHFNEHGHAWMVDITDKKTTVREAKASGIIKVNEKILELIKEENIKKGDVLNVATIAGIMAVKNTANIIPMCHNINISHSKIEYDIDYTTFEIKAICTVKVAQGTGVEMEALNGVSTCLLTIYDMCKAIDKSMEIKNIRLEYKSGGKSGTYER